MNDIQPEQSDMDSKNIYEIPEFSRATARWAAHIGEASTQAQELASTQIKCGRRWKDLKVVDLGWRYGWLQPLGQ